MLLVVAMVFWAGRGTASTSTPAPATPSAHGTASPAAAPVARPTPRPTPSPSRKPQRTPTRTTAPPRPGTALAALAGLRVRGRGPMTGYARERFGQAWLDADRNGCDTRNDMLRRDLVAKVMDGGCVVLKGTLHDPYSGATIRFVRGDGDEVDIDHVVALGNAWVSGAAAWDVKKRAALGNDPLNLLAVDAGLNRQKQDGDAATWLPPLRSYRCTYVARIVAVKKKYALSIAPAEHDAIARTLSTCPGQPLPVDKWRSPTRVDHDITDPGATPTAAPPRGFVSHSGPVSYANCTAVRAAGAAPIRRGDPGYARHLDRDGDGVGCE